MKKSEAEKWAEENLMHDFAEGALDGMDKLLEVAADYCSEKDGFSGEKFGKCKTAHELAMHLVKFRRGK